jgi:2-oxo-4-hydroxy-4-carboxy-5-ureidoimidazoline decarboxylase
MTSGRAGALDGVPDDELRARLRSCCAAGAWAERVMGGRPYASEAALLAESDHATFALDGDDLAEALAGHPRIGERASSAHGSDRRSADWSRGEQAGVTGAGTGVLDELAAANGAYEERFGHVYLVCASGRSADELLAVCRARLANDPETERGVVLQELAKINQLRLDKLLTEVS